MYDILVGKLDEFIRKYYANQLIRGAIYSGAIFFTAVIVFSVSEYLANFGRFTRGVLFYTFLGLLIFTLTNYILIPLFKLRRIGRIISYEEASRVIGNHFGEVRDKLLNVLQLNAALSGRNENTELLKAGIDQKISELRPVPFSIAIDFRKNNRYLKYVIIPAALLMILAISKPDMILNPSERIINYSDEFIPQAPFNFILENKELRAIKNQDYVVSLRMKGETLPAEVFVELDGHKVKLEKEGKTNFTYTIRNIQEKTPFRFYADGFYSNNYEIEVLPNPLLLNFEVTLKYPAYLHRDNEVITNVGDLTVPEGTEIDWSLNTENTERLVVSLEGKTLDAKRTGKDHFTYEATAKQSSVYSIHTSNAYHQQSDSIRYRLDVIKDQLPEIMVTSEPDSSTQNAMHFVGKIADDHGLRTLTFNFRKLTEQNSEQGKYESLPINFNKALLETNFYFYLSAVDLGLNAGDEIQYYFEVSDNDGVNGSKYNRTPLNRYKLASVREMEKDLDKKQEVVKDEMAEAIDEAKRIKKELSELGKKLINKKEASWQDKEQFKTLMEKQRSLKEKIKDIEEDYRHNNEMSNEVREKNEELLEKQEELKKLMEEMLTDEMKKTMEQIEALLEQMDKEKMKEEIEQMELKAEDLEKELDRSLELMKQMQFEQKLQETLDDLNALKEEQRKLEEATEKGDKEAAKENAQKQEELNKKFDELKEKLAELEKQNSEMEYPHKMEDTKPQQEEISKEMKESLENMQNGKPQKAGQNQQKAGEEMDNLAQSLSQMQQSMQQQAAEDVNALRQLLENVITSSFEQEDLMNRMEDISDSDPNYVAAMVEQKKIRDNIEMVEDSLFALSKRVVQLKPIINKEINAVNSNIDMALKEMQERRTHLSRSRQQVAMTSLNNLALLLDEVVNQLQQQMAMKMPGQGSCNKPGGQGQPKPGNSLGDMQKSLNEQLKQLQDAMNKGGKQPGKTGEDGTGGMSKELARMAARQAALREELNKMANSQENGNGKNEMKKLSELMEQTETDIVNKQITKETVRRQEEILTRLLESEKADREREWDNERKSKEYTDVIERNEKKFMEYYKKNQNEIELLRTMTPSYSEFYKKKVAEYFKLIAE